MAETASQVRSGQALEPAAAHEYYGEWAAHPHALLSVVVIGASGDLAAKRTFPALAELFEGGFLPHKFQVIGLARRCVVSTASCCLYGARCVYSVGVAAAGREGGSRPGCLELMGDAMMHAASGAWRPRRHRRRTKFYYVMTGSVLTLPASL